MKINHADIRELYLNKGGTYEPPFEFLKEVADMINAEKAIAEKAEALNIKLYDEIVDRCECQKCDSCTYETCPIVAKAKEGRK